MIELANKNMFSEGEKLNQEDAQREAELLKLKIEKGEAKDYGEAENQVEQERADMISNLDRYINNHRANVEDRTLREHQFSVFEDMRDFLKEGGRDGYIKLPTGAGKTVIFSEFIEATGLKTLVVVPTRILVGQTEEKLDQFAEDLDVGKIYSDAQIHGKDVTVITYQSLVKRLNDGTVKPEDYKCLVLDEAHTSLSERRTEAVDKFRHAIRIGFTATPKYSEDKHVGQILNTEIHSLDVKEAAEEGVVSSFSVILAETNVDITNIKIQNNGEYSEEDLEEAINVKSRNQAAAEIYEKMFKGQLGIAYCSGIKHAEDVAKIFNGRGTRAEVVSGRQTAKEQVEALARFKNGEIDILCNADILTTGFDEPKASVCLNLRPTLSPVMAEQRAGRVLRLNPEDPAKHATVVDFVDKSENKKFQPITFAEIAGTSVVYPISSFVSPENKIVSPVPRKEPEINIEGLKVITNSEEVMRIVRGKIEGRAERAPDGWITLGALAKEVGRNPVMIEKIVALHVGEGPDLIKGYLTEGGKLLPHYSPELVELINRELASRTHAPDGWMVRNALAKMLGRGNRKIEKTLDVYRETHPEWIKNFLDEREVLREYYAPELVAEIEKIIGSEKPAPEDWTMPRHLAQELGRSDSFIQDIGGRFRKDHPEWFGMYKNKAGIIFEYYSPQLIAEIRKVATVREKAPDGWMTINDAAKALGKSSPYIIELASSYREQHPDWFGDYDKRGHLAEHYSPELVAEIKKGLEGREYAPQGWVTRNFLKELLGVGIVRISNVVKKYRESNPEWIKGYLDKKGRLLEHFSPELVDKIKAELQK